MRRFPRRNSVLAALAVLTLLGTIGQVVADTRLRPDWNDMVSAAASHGLVLSGTPHAAFNELRVTDATVFGTPVLPNMRAGAITIQRPAWNLFRLTVTLQTPVRLDFAGGEQLEIWSRAFRLVRVGHHWEFGGDGVSVAYRGGSPDDVTSAETLGGEMGDVASCWRIAVRGGDIALPARGAWPNGRLVRRAAATLRLGPSPDMVSLAEAGISWSGQTARLAFGGRINAEGLLEGSGEAALGPGWAATLKRAHEAGALEAGEAEAAIGFLGLLAPDERSPVAFPVVVNKGRVEVGHTTLFTLPPLPVAR